MWVSLITRPRTAAIMVTTALAVMGSCVPSSSADGPGWGYPSVVALGDSYISGEAGRWTGNTNSTYSKVDALGAGAYGTSGACHRSLSAEIHIGGVDSINYACSGATTSALYVDQYVGPANWGTLYLGQAGYLREYARTHNVKMIALSIGGNDFRFSDVIRRCVEYFFGVGNCKDDGWVRSQFESGNVSRMTQVIQGTLFNIWEAMAEAGYASSMYTIVVQNYPSPIPTAAGFRYSGYSRQTTGGCGFKDADADWANTTALPAINRAVREAVSRFGSLYGAPAARLMDVSSAFNGRRLCESTVGLLEERGLASWTAAGAVDRTEWISQIRYASIWFGGSSSSAYQIQEDFHPNYWGQLALRNCLRLAYNGGAPRGGTCTRSGTGTSMTLG